MRQRREERMVWCVCIEREIRSDATHREMRMMRRERGEERRSNRGLRSGPRFEIKSTLRKSQLIMPPKASQKCFVDFLEHKEGRNLKYTHICQKLTSINWPPFFSRIDIFSAQIIIFGWKPQSYFGLCIRLKNKRIFLPPLLWFCHWLLISWVNTKVHPPETILKNCPF